jgi:hypothetical protein
MWIDTPSARLELAARDPLRLEGARGTLLRAVKGTLWITIDDDPRDIVLDAGEHFVVDSAEPLLVLPLGGHATVDVREACADRGTAPAARATSRQPHPAAPGGWAKWRRTLAFS